MLVAFVSGTLFFSRAGVLFRTFGFGRKLYGECMCVCVCQCRLSGHNQARAHQWRKVGLGWEPSMNYTQPAMLFTVRHHHHHHHHHHLVTLSFSFPPDLMFWDQGQLSTWH
ncbi:hypothetical protein BDP55DRAFT_666845 [Colletotrichum godetiae]|uniref:Uncharacterized protein n=1 Tax=Colletotrichum godetiae TaxID=1209918 RepID=A0AAJ0ET26_9PEZI|nr:uncharacterized protein BDP55DRAFT_666845 [Colletotrichum godetiae]KAK1674557.1 hypothetical protein BDP55DRAFT_666845 [Colletotrichum godetiae]